MVSKGTHTSSSPSGIEGHLESPTQQTSHKRILRYFHASLLAALLGSAALLHHTSEENEYPNPLPKIPLLTNKKITWDKFTKEEIHKLATEYALIARQSYSGSKLTQNELENIFLGLVSQYGADIRIIPPEQGSTLHGIFLQLGNREQKTAHYELENTIVYEQKKLQTHKSGKPIAETSSLDVFLAEFSHHLNRDGQAGRISTYAKDLARKGFQQTGMYSDLYSSEYQAHSVTEVALKAYLEPGNKFTFPEIYNLYHSYYRKIMDGESYEEIVDKEFLHDTFKGGDVESLFGYQETAFSNLDTIRAIVSKTKHGREKKALLFRYLINEGFIGLKDIDYELLARNVDFSKVNTPEFLSDFYYDKPAE